MDPYELTAEPFPNPDAVQEFSAIGNGFDPRFGFTSGGVVSIVTKSGTNHWHGDVFEFFRNGALNSKDYFTKQTDENHQNPISDLLNSSTPLYGNNTSSKCHLPSSNGQHVVIHEL